MLIRQSELYTYMLCPRQYRYKTESQSTPWQHSEHSLGGTVVGNVIDGLLNGRDGTTALLVKHAIASEMEAGKVPKRVLDDHLTMVLDRAEAIIDGWRDWYPRSGINIIGSEVEFRVKYREHELGGRFDVLATIERNGVTLFGEVDWKTYGAWGKSVNAPTIDLASDLQGSFYCLAMAQPGCEYFAGVMLSERDTPTEDLRKKHRSVVIDTAPEFYAIALVTELIPYKTGDRKGQWRGDVLYTSMRNRGSESHAAELVDEFCAAHAMDMFPRHNAKLFGRNQCVDCRFSSRCWPTTETPVATPVPDFVKGI